MIRPSVQIPRLLITLTRALIGRTEADILLGDLSEEAQVHQLDARGPHGTRMWLWRQFFKSAPSLVVRRVERSFAAFRGHFVLLIFNKHIC